MILNDIYRPIEKQLALVEKLLLEMSWPVGDDMVEAIHSTLKAGGKRLRPALLLTAAKACDYSGEEGVNLAAAMELIHTASLVHDDVIDHADTRRGIPTFKSRFGNKASILVGDHLYSRAIDILAHYGDLEVIRCVAVAACKMTASEVEQSRNRNNVNVTEEKYFSIIEGKTAALISCSCRTGALLGEIHDGEVDTLTDYGLNLGICFQITDDLLDITGDKAKMRKPLGKDIREGSLTLPFIHTMSVAGKSDKAWLAGVVESGKIDDSAIARMKDMVQDYGGVEYSLGKAKEYGAACKRRLESLQKTESRNALAMLADYVITRVS